MEPYSWCAPVDDDAGSFHQLLILGGWWHRDEGLLQVHSHFDQSRDIDVGMLDILAPIEAGAYALGVGFTDDGIDDVEPHRCHCIIVSLDVEAAADNGYA